MVGITGVVPEQPDLNDFLWITPKEILFELVHRPFNRVSGAAPNCFGRFISEYNKGRLSDHGETPGRVPGRSSRVISKRVPGDRLSFARGLGRFRRPEAKTNENSAREG